MTRRDRFRARGAGSRSGSRSPQISDGIFQGATAVFAANPQKPPQFTVIAWAPSAFPGVELWCYRDANAPSGQGATYLQLGADAGLGKHLWLDQIPKAQEFVPPAGRPPESKETTDALKAYASSRWIITHGMPDEPANWKVTLNRPFQATSDDPATRVQHNKVYAVYQHPVPGSGGRHLTAWLWVPPIDFTPSPANPLGDPAGREIWRHFQPNELGGFGVVGATPNGSTTPYTSTRLDFVEYMPAPIEYQGWFLGAYAYSMGRFDEHAIAHFESPAQTANELTPLDYRVEIVP